VISYASGNLFESPAQTLVNTVNVEGVMGKGIALTFKRVFPEMFREYQDLCEQNRLRIGSLHLFQSQSKLILNFPTKERWRNPSRLSYIEEGLRTFVATYEQAGIYSIAFPPLGCGNGELDFSDVQPLMERYLAPLPIQVFIYSPLPQGAVAEHRTPEEIAGWMRSMPEALPFGEVWHDLRVLLQAEIEVPALVGERPFVARYVTHADAVRIRAPHRTTQVARDDFHDLWGQLRDHGVLSPASLPAHLGSAGMYALAVLNLLPYVKTIPLAPTYDELRQNTTRALQVAPVASVQGDQRELVLT
jgi:O-acetyl-ADP-ribose deacetylase (regulator of RNase III)